MRKTVFALNQQKNLSSSSLAPIEKLFNNQKTGLTRKLEKCRSADQLKENQKALCDDEDGDQLGMDAKLKKSGHVFNFDKLSSEWSSSEVELRNAFQPRSVGESDGTDSHYYIG